MPLTADQTQRLFELYEIPVNTPSTVVTTDMGYPIRFDYSVNVRSQLLTALETINASSAQSQRVGAILAEYDSWALDPSNIDKNGYSFRASRNKKAIISALYPYTGIKLIPSTDNRTPL